MKYDVAVIGGGPAGMMAAGRAGELGARVILLEKNKRLGIKLLITGNGRCNLTNNTEEIRELIGKFGENGKFLFSPFHKFGVSEVIRFFESRGVKLKTEIGNRVFPVSDRAQDVLRVLIDYLKKSNVEMATGAEVTKIIKQSHEIEKIILSNGQEIVARNYIICTGGKAYPLTGSTGDGYEWLKKLGHNIISPRPALVPIVIKENFIKQIEGLSLKNVEISLYKNNRKIESVFGEAIFTADGISGPAIFGLSKKVGELLPGVIELRIDFAPKLDFKKFDNVLQKSFQVGSNKIIKNVLCEYIAPKLISVIIALSAIDGEKKVNLVTREERKKIVHLIKGFVLSVKELGGYDKAMITAGGVSLNEVDSKTMKSKTIRNLFLAGEILDLDGPTGGYNLQICWSTGYVAGDSAGQLL